MFIFDIDGVIANSISAIIANISAVLSCDAADLNNDQHTITLRSKAVPQPIVLAAAIDATVHYVDSIPMYDRALEFLQMYYESTGEPLIFLTARCSMLSHRQPVIEEATRYWLSKHLDGLPFEVFFETDKYRWLREHTEFISIVEDRLATANSLHFLDRVWLVNRQWNAGRPVESHVRRINTLMDIVGWSDPVEVDVSGYIMSMGENFAALAVAYPEIETID